MRKIPFLALLIACGNQGADTLSQAQAAQPDAAIAPPPRSVTDPKPEAVVAKWKGGTVTYGQVHQEIGGTLMSLEVQYLLDRYENQHQAMDQLIDQALLEAEAESVGMGDIDTLLEAEIEKKTPTPTRKQVEDFYPLVARQLGGAPLDQVYPRLEAELRQQAMSERYQAYISGLREKAGVELSFPYPDLPRATVPVGKNDPILGKKGAPVQIVQFAEYQCFFCQKVNPTLDKVMADYKGKVNLVFKDFPLAMHGNAVPAAMAAHCADEQGKYWEMSRLLLNNQDNLSPPELEGYAQTVGIDGGKFSECMASGRHEQTVHADMEQGRKLGVQATPTFFINGIQMSGAQPYERFAAVIDRELAK